MDNKKNQVFILLGSNLGEREKCLSNAVDAISKLGVVLNRSSLYKTEPWKMESNDWFLNQVILVETELEAESLMTKLLDIESNLGRVRTPSKTSEYTSRTIDLDMLYFNQSTIQTELLSIPHPRLHERKFTLLPLAEIAPSFVHPILKKTQLELLEACADDSEVIAFETK